MSRVAIVTGGSRGIGAAISIALKNADYSVAATFAGNQGAADKFTDETVIATGGMKKISKVFCNSIHRYVAKATLNEFFKFDIIEFNFSE